MRQFLRGLAVLAAAFWVAGLEPAAAQQVTVFAAASLKDALEDAAKTFTASTGTPVRFSFAASSALAKQIEQGAPADLFASADLDWMDYLAQRKLIRPDTRVDLVGNRLVVVAAKESPIKELKLDAASLKAALGDGRLTTGEISSVPVGKYAKAALEKLGLWAEVQPRLAMTESVRAALALVARGEAPLGIVYATDAAAEPKVKIVATFPADSHAPIVYPFAVTAEAKSDGARQFLEFLKGPAARRAFETQGFSIIGPAGVRG
jgi:molybdate transport system substrate-binding protein